MRVGIRQFFKFAVVGIASNLLLFFLYIVLTKLGFGPKLAMSLLYALGVTQTFVFNRNWTFQHKGDSRQTFWRYVLAYLSGYVINLTILAVLVDRLGYPHAIVQGFTILGLAAYLFIVQRNLVFRTRSPEKSNNEHHQTTNPDHSI